MQSPQLRQPTPTPKIEPWQYALRNHKEARKHTTAPPAAPLWAGGQGVIPPNRTLSWQEMEQTEEGSRSTTLLPHEAAMLLHTRGTTIENILRELEGIDQSPSPRWIAPWARCFWSKARGWSVEETRNLRHYWKLPLLGITDIALLLERSPKETAKAAQQIGLEKKPETGINGWCGIHWNFHPEEDSDPKYLQSEKQHMVAEASATRFSLLYEQLKTMTHTDPGYRRLQHELDRIVRLHTRIFEKYINAKSRRFNQYSQAPALTQEDLTQVGHTAIFECLRRWHPEKGINFSRRAVCMAINREMIAWLESQRLVSLPDKIRAVARRLKAAQDAGQTEEEYQRLVGEAGARCVHEANKHRNTYAYTNNIQLVDTFNEEEAEHGNISAGVANCMVGFSTYTEAPTNGDLTDIILDASKKLKPPESKALLLYYGISEKGEHIGTKTLDEIGQIEGVTKERVRQRIAKGREKIKRWLEAKDIRCTQDAFEAT
jgi:RNA polymerase sigma factor (sigma-70 family)